jgi:hypothetical protein
LLPWLLFSAGASVALSRHATNSAGEALLLSTASLAVPLTCLGAVAWLLDGRGLHDAVADAARLGAPRTRVAGAYVAFALGLCALLGALPLAVVLVASGAFSELGRELLTTLPLGLLGGAAYGALFLFGSTFARGNGRSAVLILDFLFGGSASLGVLLPRGHLRGLLGGELALQLSPRVSSVFLVLLIVAYSTWAVRRASRAH